MEIYHAVVAVDVDRCGTENDEENNNNGDEEDKGKHREAAAAVAAAFFNMKPAMRALADRVRHRCFAFWTFGERHG